MLFYSASKTARPIRLSEHTREFAYESMCAKYGTEAKKTPNVSLDHIVDYESMSMLQQYDTAITEIVSKAPVRICEGELVSGSAMLGDAIKHVTPAVYKGKPVCDSVSHLTLGFDKVVFKGMDEIEREVRQALATKTQRSQIEFLNSMLHSIECFRIWHSRYLEALAKKTDSCALLAHRNLQNVPFKPASNFHEAVQSLWIVFAFTRLCGNWPGIGRIDMILGRYLKEDLQNQTITIEYAREILAHFFIKGCEWIGGGEYEEGGDAQHYQNIVLAGVDSCGNDITNEVTYLVLDIIEELGIGDFPIAVRVNKNSQPKLLLRMAEVMRHGGGIVAVYNEDLILESLTAYGYQLEEARQFANDGCWEVQIPGKTFFRYRPFDGLQILQQKTLQGYDNAKLTFNSFEDIYQHYILDLKETLELIYNEKANELNVKPENGKDWTWKPSIPCTVVSLFTEGCAQKGLSYLEGGAIYNILSPHIGGLPDVANSLYALKKLVYDEKKMTFHSFMDVLRHNWDGNELLRQYVLNQYQYFGNDNDEADEMAVRLLDDFADAVGAIDGRCPVSFIPGVSTFGRQIEWINSRIASPHGRKKGETLSGNLSPTPGTDLSGATAIIKSYCKPDLKKQTNGAALDLKLYPSTVNGENGKQALIALIKGFLDLGGFFMQIDVVDNADLKRAQLNPNEYKNLAVRISGWSARFITLNEDWQNMIIKRETQGM